MRAINDSSSSSLDLIGRINTHTHLTQSMILQFVVDWRTQFVAHVLQNEQWNTGDSGDGGDSPHELQRLQELLIEVVLQQNESEDVDGQ